MEPMACTAKVDGYRADVWAGTQDPLNARSTAAKALTMDVENVAQAEDFDLLARPDDALLDLAGRHRAPALDGVNPFDGHVVKQGAPGEAAGSPAYAWLPVVIPPDAVALTFDLIRIGEAGDNLVVFGLAGTSHDASRAIMRPMACVALGRPKLP